MTTFMNRYLLRTVAGLSIAIGATGSLQAQDIPGLNLAALSIACEGETPACGSATQNALDLITTSGMDQVSKNLLLAQLASVILEAAKDNPSGNGFYANLIRDISGASSDPDQKNTLLVVANLIEDGNAGEVNSDVLLSSPA